MSRRRTRAVTTQTATVAASGAEEGEPSAPVDAADLESAWAELRHTVGESNVTSFRACSRPERYLGDDPDAVRAIAGTIRRVANSTEDDPST
ncbi:hypothetical protein [Arthrobacter sp. TS-15]|uniref:hypothetical protein n=1 Tax=Arthrobacter sp. TS-15 TaxID=2510797 RepID=UPI001EE92128|nr:hypothetical protein [Arthrobacter sp. TS-15]